jgi:hypothetical protein
MSQRIAPRYLFLEFFRQVNLTIPVNNLSRNSSEVTTPNVTTIFVEMVTTALLLSLEQHPIALRL